MVPIRPLWLLPPGRLHPLWWVPVGAALIGIDYAGGFNTPYPLLYVIPVTVAAWYSGRRAAVALAVVVPLMHAVFLVTVWEPPGNLVTPMIATALRGAVVLVMGLWVSRLSDHERKLHHYVQRLEGLLPICAFCKSIRNTADEWEPIEGFISRRSEAQFSHTFCPSCSKTHYPDFDYHGVSSTDVN